MINFYPARQKKPAEVATNNQGGRKNWKASKSPYVEDIMAISICHVKPFRTLYPVETT